MKRSLKTLAVVVCFVGAELAMASGVQAVCFLVYAKGAEPDSDEPLIRVTETEDEIYAFKPAIEKLLPGFEIWWEEVPWYRSGIDDDERQGVRTLYLVLEAAPGNEVGIAAFDDLESAEALTRQRTAQGGGEFLRVVTTGSSLNDIVPSFDE